ncbi:bifunctional diaminohydroxyphosphoribosylaminopyrimidine deaminase/5-amino-6-(5-phosphoribosylamino)uracil reductase RibD [Sporolactobacillus laevolacticus]|uniref:Riboflavin biosynthesis protein RibD n=1 Tax=Sporolactobacillus laevolacticus DSM 442 TaxID=1395513 RepID=V6IWE4_9BACL|nr:bifunctional diaminohydroxyphosphoribosylaminopyrimidine deaminase/5-amino-6-(5-phosphoribosylamino)uracil reductase RibD [Sporolactobacillus laevolacticus]EST11525.1 5-amino-6-(5-phosphoribosylamino)uracil reductase [Sporolactobacillus laevolacticus DSM 442]
MQDKDYMELAIHLAQMTRGQTSPNPAVGAVVVNHGSVVGVGAHLKAGEAHAEVNALRMAGDRAEGGVMYVTLEPCSHFGRTPPCADLIIKKKLKRVVIASRDPNPLVSGKGIERMRQAGITVDTGVMKKEADALNPFFFHYIRTGAPFVTLKIASTLDGKTATSIGESKWITNDQSRHDVHALREQHDAILVGIGTVLADDPQLTVRLNDEAHQPIRVVLDTHLRIPEEARLVTDSAAPTWIVTGNTIDEKKAERLNHGHIDIFQLPEEKIDVRKLLALLGEKGITSLLVEGGATVHGSFVKSRSFDRLIAYLAPKLIGGTEAIPAVGGSGIEHLAEAAKLSIERVENIGGDLKITAIPEKECSSCLQDW